MTRKKSSNSELQNNSQVDLSDFADQIPQKHIKFETNEEKTTRVIRQENIPDTIDNKTMINIILFNFIIKISIT